MTKEQERSKKYGCDGYCHTSTTMCPAVDTCPETKRGEGRATIMAVLFVLSVPIVTVAIIAWAIFSLI